MRGRSPSPPTPLPGVPGRGELLRIRAARTRSPTPGIERQKRGCRAGLLPARSHRVISVVIPVLQRARQPAAAARGDRGGGAARAARPGSALRGRRQHATARGRSSPSWPRKHPEVHGIRFRRNFGKAAALSAGFRAARGDIILTLDADLQDDPAEIPRFLAALDEAGADGASTWSAAGSACATIPGTRSGPAGSSTAWSAG